MKLLAIETSTPCLSSALWEDGAPVASFSLLAGPRHAEVLMPSVDHLCRQAGWSVHDVEAVAVGNGPGLFTGLRVGLATARSIAAALGRPAVGVGSLDALAHPHRRRPGLLAAVLDARRSEVFWALYRSDGRSLALLRGPEVAPPAGVASDLAGAAGEPAPVGAAPPFAASELSSPAGEPPSLVGSVLVVGDGAWRYRDLFEASGVEIAGPADMYPSACAVAELGWRQLLEKGAPAGLPAPLYLRQADVRIGWEEVAGRVGSGRGGPDMAEPQRRERPGHAALPATGASLGA